MRALQPRERRLLFLLALTLLAFVAARWALGPSLTVTTEHYTIQSTAPRVAAENTGRVAEFVYAAHAKLLGELGLKPIGHGRLQMRLYETREEFRDANGIEGWAEAIYREPVCHQYFATGTPNPYHWMVHEATHQLNREVAGLDLPQWLNEGLAGCFCTSRIRADRLDLDEVDSNTYPVWWTRLMATSGKLDQDKRGGSVIPLRAIVSGEGGPRLDSHVNLYYLHWWTLVRHLLREHPDALAALLRSKADLAAFETLVGPIDKVERAWYDSVLALKKQVEGTSTPPVRL